MSYWVFGNIPQNNVLVWEIRSPDLKEYVSITGPLGSPNLKDRGNLELPLRLIGFTNVM